jgi:hypothetical protein
VGNDKQRNLRKLYKDFYDWLVLYLDEQDPVGLLGEGNPGREYEPEAPHILAALPKVASADELTERIHAIFVAYFDSELAGPLSNYVGMAGEIYLKWHQMRLQKNLPSI